jgi:hypothetical protein
MGSPAAMPPSTKSKGNATKEMISAIRSPERPPQETLIGEKHQGSSSTAPDRRRMRQRPLVIKHRAEIAHVEPRAAARALHEMIGLGSGNAFGIGARLCHRTIL